MGRPYRGNHPFHSIVEGVTRKLEPKRAEKTDFTEPHSERVSEVMEAMAEAMATESSKKLLKKRSDVLELGYLKERHGPLVEELRPYQVELAGVVGIAHDVGKRMITEKFGHAIWEKKNLSKKEWGIIHKHPRESRIFIEKIPGRFSKLVAGIVLHHHAHFAGGGYPGHIKRERIPMLARMLAVADALDSMIYPRPYREKMTLADALKELKRNKGTQFDPDVVDLLAKMVRKKNLALRTYVQ